MSGTFRFKRFSVRNELSSMKVNTDGVLLGAWAAIAPQVRRILDVGTGTGVIALMMAQRTEGFAHPVLITGVDVEQVGEARANADASPWGGRISFLQADVRQYAPSERFDLIVSNPPFFVSELLSPDAGRMRARHAVTLPYDALRDAAARMLDPAGRFSVILPAAEARLFVDVCKGTLVPVRRTDVRTIPCRAPKRVLLEFAMAGEDAALPGLRHDELVIGTGEHECYTEEYRALTRDFYLKF